MLLHLVLLMPTCSANGSGSGCGYRNSGGSGGGSDDGNELTIQIPSRKALQGPYY